MKTYIHFSKGALLTIGSILAFSFLASSQPTNFSYVTTGYSHVIYIPAGSVLLNGVPLAINSYIGVFYDNAGVPSCGGYVIWNGNANVMSAWADIAFSSIKDGFNSNEVMQWKIWDYVSDSVYDATPEYFPAGTGTFVNAGNFTPGGMSGLTSLHVGVLTLNITSSVTQTSCTSASDGAIQLSVTGGVTPYTYQWSNSCTSSNNQGLLPGIYNVAVTDFNGSAAVHSACVTSLASMNISITDTFYSNIHHLVAAGGTSTCSYLWSTGTVTDNITVTDPGTYSLTVTNSNGCTVVASILISALPLQIIPIVTNTCYGTSVGEIQLTVNGGTTPYTFQWSNNATTSSITGLSSGTYYLTVTSTDGQTETDQATVNTPTALVSGSYDAGSGTYNFYTNISGGTSPYSFIWSNGDTTGYMTTNNPGNYYLTITDDNSCTITLSVIAYLPIQVNQTVTDPLCYGMSTGQIQLSVSGGLTPYTYHWSNNATTSAITGLMPSTYHITITSADGQVITAQAQVISPAALQVNITNTPGTGNYFLNSTTSGGTLPYSYSWSTGETDEDITVINAGVYYLTVTDDNSCNITGSVFANLPLQVDHTITNPLCSGMPTGQILLSVSGGLTPYSYHWSNNETTSLITGLTAGNFHVTVTSADGQTITDLAQVISPASMWVSITNIPGTGNYILNSTTSGGTLPYSYSWSTGETIEDITVINAGVYYLTVTDANSCTESAYVFTSQPSPWTYTWYPSNHTILVPANSVLIDGNPLTPGSYIGVFYSLPSGGIACGGYIGWAGSTTAISAYGDDVTTLQKDGFSANELIQWKIWDIMTGIESVMIPVYDITSFPSQGYYVSGGISGLISLNNQIPALVVSSTTINVTCFSLDNGAIYLTVSGGMPPYSYLWSTGATTTDISGLTAGVYDVTVTDVQGTTEFQSIEITQPVLLQASIIIAGTDSLQVMVTGGSPPVNYNWSTGETTQNIIAVTSGNFSVTVTDANGCITTAVTTVNLTFTITGQVSGGMKSTVHCSVLLINKPLSGGYNAVDFMVTTDGNYSFDNVIEGNYLLYAIPDPFDGTVNLPSYYGNELSWNIAQELNITQSASGININLEQYNNGASGNGSIGGYIYYSSEDVYETDIYDNEWFGGSVSGIKTAYLARNIPVILFDQDMIAAAYTLSDENGHFQFNELFMGSYSVYSEKAGLATIPVQLELNEINPEIENIIINITNSGIYGFYTLPEKETGVSIYPKPANDILFINIRTNKPEDFNFVISSNLGIQMYDNNYSLNSGSNTITVPVYLFPEGLYYMQINSKSTGTRNERFIIIR